MLKERMGDVLREAGAPFLFAPAEGPPFFDRVRVDGDGRAIPHEDRREARTPAARAADVLDDAGIVRRAGLAARGRRFVCWSGSRHK